MPVFWSRAKERRAPSWPPHSGGRQGSPARNGQPSAVRQRLRTGRACRAGASGPSGREARQRSRRCGGNRTGRRRGRARSAVSSSAGRRVHGVDRGGDDHQAVRREGLGEVAGLMAGGRIEHGAVEAGVGQQRDQGRRNRPRRSSPGRSRNRGQRRRFCRRRRRAGSFSRRAGRRGRAERAQGVAAGHGEGGEAVGGGRCVVSGLGDQQRDDQWFRY